MWPEALPPPGRCLEDEHDLMGPYSNVITCRKCGINWLEFPEPDDG